jgi:hypothetical protein
MLYRIGPAMLSLALAGAVPRCTHIPEGDGGFDGYAGASGASVGGVAGATGGSAGTSSHGGSAGLSGVGGAAGLGAGQGGESGISGGGLSSGGSAGATGGSAGATGGSAGASGGSTAGTGAVQEGSFTLSATTLLFVAACQFTPQTLTITNTSSIPLTWHASGDLSTTLLTPTGSTLQPGEQVSVSVLSQIHPAAGSVGFSGSTSVISIDADVAPSQSIQVVAQLSGKPPPSAPLPPDIDFGDVPVGSGATAFVPVNTTPILVISSQTAPEFSLSGAAPNFQGTFGQGWTVTFRPAIPGAAQATLAFTDFSESTCPPNTIAARGTGIVVGAAGCASSTLIPFGTPCGTNQVCAMLPTPAIACVTELTLVGSPVTSAPGALFSGLIASGTAASGSQFAALTASIDWGDQTVSAGSIVPTNPPTTLLLLFTVTGSHTYASSGSFQGTVTVTDQTTHFSAETTFTASS